MTNDELTPFKVGDKVRVTQGANEDLWHAFDIGDEGFVTVCRGSVCEVRRCGGFVQSAGRDSRHGDAIR